MMRLILAFAAALLAGCATTASTSDHAPQISLETLQRVTQELSSDAFQGRAPGTEGETRTVEALAREFA
ncbi:MAG: peptidase M28, partial [Sphingosinicella sp.]